MPAMSVSGDVIARLRERLNEIEQAVSGDRHAESYREFETAYETLYIEHEQAIAALECAEAERDALRRYVAEIWAIVQLDREAATEERMADAWLGIYEQAGAAMGDPRCRWVLGEEATDGE